MTIDSVPLKLHKANLELQLQIGRLLQESGQRHLQFVSQVGEEGLEEARTEIDGVRKAENWQSLATVPAESFWRVFQQHVGDAQEAAQAAAKSQAAFTSGLQEAIEGWQRAVGEAFGSHSLGQQPAVQPLQDAFRQWTNLWPALAGQDRKTPAGDA
ncbi:hypothetical protein LA66_15050 [Aureimonas altamirensis]|uniref:Phasin domain-containing protein n=1 Tax=Aureimonas altamirensis TaxID=370622 RepID=A0A0B1Q0K9_9HYPH|nr:phasin family protein [Aureimonas altamirensis]KHJ53899.1 hypothetical protein LA66_15050 [Aureimonas altamirensis]